jgi:hypothetical protein
VSSPREAARTNLARYRACVVRRSQIALVLALVTTGAQAANAGAPDRTPPAFGGLVSATTCIPGPVGGTRLTSYRLTWAPARDKLTPTRRIVYSVHRATSVGGEDFSAPTYTTRRGALSFVTPPLPSNVSNYFVVRARDGAGNRDRNRHERLGRNLCY